MHQLATSSYFLLQLATLWVRTSKYQNSNTSFVKVGLYSSAPIHKIEDLDVTIGTHIGNISCGTSLNDYIIDGNPAFTALAFFD